MNRNPEHEPGTRSPEPGTASISVVVPAFNEERVLASSLASIRASMAAFSAARIDPELIVCDNNSTDATAAIAAAAGARVVFEPINQIARARNTGAAAGRGDWLLFIDADSHPTFELCADVAAAIRSGGCIGGGAVVAVDPGEPVGVRFVVALWNAISRATRWAAGSFLFCRADAFRRVGGFSEDLFVSEDVELCRRVKRLARSMRLEFQILTRHPVHTSARKAYLYTPRELLAFYGRVIATGGRTMRSADDCWIWYDGRR